MGRHFTKYPSNYIKASTDYVSGIEYEDNLSEAYVLNRIADGGSIDEWGDIQAVCESAGLGVEYNICIDNTLGDTTNESAFYVMHYNSGSDYWDTDTSDFIHYEIDYSDPDWRKKIKEFAINFLTQVINR